MNAVGYMSRRNHRVTRSQGAILQDLCERGLVIDHESGQPLTCATCVDLCGFVWTCVDLCGLVWICVDLCERGLVGW